MAFETVFDASQATVYKFEKQGDTLEGYYMGSFDHTGDYGPTKKHIFQTPEGAIAVFGQRHLMQVLPNIKPGTMVRVTYDNELASKAKGRAPMKLFKFQQDKKNTIDVVQVDFTPTDNFEAVDDSLSEELETLDEVVPQRASRPALPARAPSAAAQAAVQARLAGRSKQTA